MELPISTLAIILIMIVIKGLIDGLLRPLVEAKGWDTLILRYAAWALGIVLVVLAYILPNNVFMIVLLSLAAGCGSNILQEFLAAFGSKLTTYTSTTSLTKERDKPPVVTSTVTTTSSKTPPEVPPVPSTVTHSQEGPQ